MSLITILSALGIIIAALLIRRLFLSGSSAASDKRFSETIASALFWGMVALILVVVVMKS